MTSPRARVTTTICRSAALAAACLGLLAPAAPAAPAAQLGLGVADQPGGAAQAKKRGKVAYRYQYLAGAIGSGSGWASWNPDGTFVSRYVRESLDARVTPVKPDLWGFVQQRAAGDDAATVPAAVGSSGDPDAAGLPDTVAGLAQAVVRLRDRHAPNVRLAWHLSTWGTRLGTTYDDPSRRRIDALARRSARFARSLRARFDLIFNDVADRDDGFRRHVLGENPVVHHWGPGDLRRHLRWVRGVTRATRTAMVLWQLPLGHRRLPDTWRRFRDNRVDLLLGSRARTRRVRNAGVAALLFGAGADGCTTAQTDGGHFFRHARRYARRPLRVRRSLS